MSNDNDYVFEHVTFTNTCGEGSSSSSRWRLRQYSIPGRGKGGGRVVVVVEISDRFFINTTIISSFTGGPQYSLRRLKVQKFSTTSPSCLTYGYRRALVISFVLYKSRNQTIRWIVRTLYVYNIHTGTLLIATY